MLLRKLARLSLYLGGLILPAVLLLTVAGCPRKPASRPQATLVADEEGYLGDKACAGCHVKEFESHRHTRHTVTLRPATREALGSLAPTAGAVPLAGYTLSDGKQGLTLTRAERSVPLSLVLGSGKTGMTFVSVLDATRLLETRMSYFAPWHMWDITPGQEHELPTDDTFGRIYPADAARKCLGCHATKLPKSSLMPEPRMMGVGCEACHGPGKEHVVAASVKGATDLRMEKLETWSPEKLNGMCGKCHRSTGDIDLESPEALQTQRFQPYALQRSACRTDRGQVLSCSACHDPHADATPDQKRYDAVCLSCHGGPSATRLKNAQGVGKVCPVNPKADCVKCHMPPRNAFATTTIPAKMADHLIAIPRKHSPP